MDQNAQGRGDEVSIFAYYVQWEKNEVQLLVFMEKDVSNETVSVGEFVFVAFGVATNWI